MRRLVFATRNQGKVKEMRAMLADLEVEVVSQEEAGVREEVVEDGQTFEENALKKARFVAERTGQWAVADDSGICIDALRGAPGIHSARWGGQGKSDEEVVQFTLEQIKDVAYDKRGAVFVSTLALVAPDGRHWIFWAKCAARLRASHMVCHGHICLMTDCLFPKATHARSRKCPMRIKIA